MKNLAALIVVLLITTSAFTQRSVPTTSHEEFLGAFAEVGAAYTFGRFEQFTQYTGLLGVAYGEEDEFITRIGFKFSAIVIARHGKTLEEQEPDIPTVTFSVGGDMYMNKRIVVSVDFQNLHNGIRNIFNDIDGTEYNSMSVALGYRLDARAVAKVRVTIANDLPQVGIGFTTTIR